MNGEAGLEITDLVVNMSATAAGVGRNGCSVVGCSIIRWFHRERRKPQTSLHSAKVSNRLRFPLQPLHSKGTHIDFSRLKKYFV